MLLHCFEAQNTHGTDAKRMRNRADDGGAVCLTRWDRRSGDPMRKMWLSRPGQDAQEFLLGGSEIRSEIHVLG